ncbi:Glycosyltransferase 34 [uncultured Caudovirales phage]|uniref:Glycosyltransferase 34 n=1 Tax=uncultured Caudovirales phage TaxID=2100421 RepID=A0A6J7WJW4_9CAUD|nr:Glycosyltransferase 34 [uncultured Caudovirales phage]
MFAVVSMSTHSIADLADPTDKYKKEYCDTNGYEFFSIKDEDFKVFTKPYSSFMDWNKAFYVNDLLKARPDIEWVLISEADATITNMKIQMEDKIDNDYHVIIPVDRLTLNGGNWLLRNSEQGRAYIQHMVDVVEDYREDQSPEGKLIDKWGLQQVMIDTIDQNKDIVKIVEQRYMNSYEPEIYDYCDASRDCFGNDAAWQKGDWIIHWPGIRHNLRLERVARLEDMVTR